MRGLADLLPQAARPCELGWPRPNEQVYLQSPVGQWTFLLLALLANLNQTYIRVGYYTTSNLRLPLCWESKDGWGLGVKSVSSWLCLELWDNGDWKANEIISVSFCSIPDVSFYPTVIRDGIVTALVPTQVTDWASWCLTSSSSIHFWSAEREPNVLTLKVIFEGKKEKENVAILQQNLTYYFLKVAVTNYHKLGGLKQQKLILFQL